MIKPILSSLILMVALLSTPFLVQAQQPVLGDKAEKCLPQLSDAERCRRVLGVEALWWREGRKLYKSNCKSCHYRENEVGASFLYEESKSQRAWDRVFIERYPKCAKDGSWSALSERQLQDINDYLYRYAFGTSGIYEARMG